jgi:(1->4)-alpha-D-glucan 1-alpha-D-glucosylmutase
MGVGANANAWWKDVLENGPGAPAARFFDIDWTPVKASLQAKLLLPILGDQYGRVLERGELQLVFRDGLLLITYGASELPINPKLAPLVYRRAVEPLTAILGAENPQLHEFLSILASLENLPSGAAQDAAKVAERQREKEVARSRLARLVSECPPIADQLAAAVESVSGVPGKPESFDALHELLEAQAYRLAYWRTASHEINYRRFFDVNTLAGLRIEDPDVFAATHQLLGRLLQGGAVQAVRVDHADGLFDPARYFTMLQALPGTSDGRSLYVLAEKVLSGGERCPSQWAVSGTTGYNYLNDLNGLFVHAAEARRMRRTYVKLTSRTESFDDVLYASKRLIMTTAMASELSVLAHTLERIAEGNRRSRDFTLESLRDAITEVVACFPVYRTYVDEAGWTPGDRAVVETAIRRARRRNPAMESSLFDFFREVMLPRTPEEPGQNRRNDRREGYPPADAVEAAERLRFAMKLQQYTGPVQAKGLEDTAYYRYNLLLSLNEVGGDVERFGRSVREFHEANAARLRDWPFEMLATATHDTKLGEDVRARLNVLSEIPDEWAREAGRWMRLNRPHRTIVDGEPAPDRNDEYRFYQALVGIWPPLDASHPAPAGLIERLQAYMIKSVKEAKLHTSWLTPNQEYEDAVARFVERTLGGPGAAKFLSVFQQFHRRLAPAGMVNALAQVALKIGSPGVPDFYQGTELWDLSLVDPDNRRAVDFDLRSSLLAEMEDILSLESAERAAAVGKLVNDWGTGHVKLFVTAVGLRLRRQWPELFLTGRYVPLTTESTVDGELVAFARILDAHAAIFVVPRLCARLSTSSRPLPLGGDAWKTSRVMLPPDLAGRVFRHEITGGEIQPMAAGAQSWVFAGQVFETIPVGILTAA